MDFGKLLDDFGGAGPIGEGLGGLLGLGADAYYNERMADEKRASRKDQKEIALKNIALTKEQMAAAEKQRGFERLMKLLGAGNNLVQQSAGANRLMALRNAG